MTPAAYRGEDAGVAGTAETATGPATTSCAVGLAALWYFLCKRLRYPVLYAYLRTGNDGAFLAQDVHNVALALGAFAMLLLLARFGRRLFHGRAATVAVVAAGLAGGAGLALLAQSGFAGPGDTALAYRNYNARRIAGELFIAESTVYTHLKRIYRKVDVHSKQELIDRIDAHRAQAG